MEEKPKCVVCFLVPGVEREAEDGEGTAAKTRALRSHTSDLCTSKRAPHLLPVQCIICKHEKYKHESYTRKRIKEKLIQCETLTAGKLLLAAEGRKDESLLLHIQDRDLVASESRYHFTCFRDYTRYLSKKINETESNLYENGYKYFCETVIEERLLRRREVLRLCRLNMLFKDIVRQREGLTISSYKAHSLKARLQKLHPFLKFQKASTTYFVYVDDLTAEEILQEVAASSSSSSSPSSDSEAEGNDADTPGSSHTQHNTGIITKDSSRLLYHAALTLKDIIRNTAKSSPKLPWPPTAKDLTLESALNMVPDQLFNFVAWTCGISMEPSDNERVEVTLEDRRKIVSTCQDIITLSTKGRWLMPKQCSLAMAVRHTTGSAQLIGLLNGLGHSSSNSQVLEHDTALAHLQIERGEIYIPQNISAEVPATLVWDNNDFGEETLSGKGTTHNTNGIIIQQAMAGDSASLPGTSRQRTRERSVNPPPLKGLIL